MTTIMNKYDHFNPLYTHHATPKDDVTTLDNSKTNNKDAKRSDKIARDTIIKTGKDTSELIENKIAQLGIAVSDKIDDKLTAGFSALSKQFAELINIFKYNTTKPTMTIATITKTTTQNEPTTEDNNTQNTTLKDDNTTKTKPEEPNTLNYNNLMTKFNTLPPGQQHLQNTTTTPTPDNTIFIDPETEPTIKELVKILNATNVSIENERKHNFKRHTELQHEINNLKDKITKMSTIKNTNNQQNTNQHPTTQPTKPTYSQMTAKPTLNIDIDGNPTSNENNATKTENLQPIDKVTVRKHRTPLPPRPNMSTTTHTEAQNKLQQHNLEVKQQIDNHETKIKERQDIPKSHRDEKISKMFEKASRTVGIAPITQKHIKQVCELLTSKGILKRSEPYPIRIQRTIKSLVKAWTIKNLRLTEEDWDKITIKEIRQTSAEESGIIFMECESRDDVALITSKARNLSNSGDTNNPRLVMYVDKRSKKRFNAIQIIAKSIRQTSQNTVQTTIRNGKHDYLLRKKEKNDPTPWNLIPPLIIDHELPDFEIGMFKNIYAPNEDENDADAEDDGNEEVELLDEKETDDLSNEIRRQYVKDAEADARRNPKRDLTKDDSPKIKNKKKSKNILSASEEEEDSDNDQKTLKTQNKILHSTLAEDINHSTNTARPPRTFSVPETPDNIHFVTRFHSETQYQNSKQNHNENQKTELKTNHE